MCFRFGEIVYCHPMDSNKARRSYALYRRWIAGRITKRCVDCVQSRISIPWMYCSTRYKYLPIASLWPNGKKEKEEMYVTRKPHSRTHMHANTLKWMEIDEKKDFKLIDNSWQSHIGLSESFIKCGPQMIRYCFVCALRAYENSSDSSFVSRDLKLMIFWAIGLSSVVFVFGSVCACVWLHWLMCQIAWIIRFN